MGFLRVPINDPNRTSKKMNSSTKAFSPAPFSKLLWNLIFPIKSFNETQSCPAKLGWILIYSSVQWSMIFIPVESPGLCEPGHGRNRNDLWRPYSILPLNDLVTSYGGTLLIVNVPHQSSAFREEYPEYLEIDYTSMDQDNWVDKTLKTMESPIWIVLVPLPDYEKILFPQ